MCNRTYLNGCLIGNGRFTTNCAGCNYLAPSVTTSSINLQALVTSNATTNGGILVNSIILLNGIPCISSACNYVAPTPAAVVSTSIPISGMPAMTIAPTPAPTQVSGLSSSTQNTSQSTVILYGAIGGVGSLLFLSILVFVVFYHQTSMRRKAATRISTETSQVMMQSHLSAVKSKLQYSLGYVENPVYKASQSNRSTMSNQSSPPNNQFESSDGGLMNLAQNSY